MQISDSLEKIREYTRKNEELTRCHHFLFNLPLEKSTHKADVVVIGLNPGESDSDWNLGKDFPTEESSEFDFHEEFGKGRSSVRWSQYCRKYLGSSNIVQTEFFFWSSRNLNKEFSDRFGYKFQESPHFLFCRDRNKELLDFHKPRLVVSTGTSYSDLFS